MRFKIDKLYADCVTPEGSVAVVYSARLSWGPMHFSYGAVLEADTGHAPQERQAFKSGELSVSKHELLWEHKCLRAYGAWRGPAGPQRELWKSPPEASAKDRTIYWDCLTPAADAELCLRGGAMLRGRGYAERLTMTLPPWRLPMDELRWGRFIADDGSAARVWIEWRGGAERQWLWSESGTGLNVHSISEHAIEAAGERLELAAEKRVLRAAPLARSLFGRAHLLAHLLPRKLARAHETKWLCRAALASPEHQQPRPGWAIHEVVRWG